MSATTTTPTSTDRRPRALLLDDDALVQKLSAAALRCRGFDVLVAADGATGVSMLLDELLQLDALVVDLDLPGRDAWSFLRLIRGAGGEHDLAVIVIATASTVTPALRAQLRTLGADAVVDRAAGPAALAAAVELTVRHPGLGLRRRAVAIADSIAGMLVPVPAAV
jgi:DNA-binding response OmpR family regulator